MRTYILLEETSVSLLSPLNVAHQLLIPSLVPFPYLCACVLAHGLASVVKIEPEFHEMAFGAWMDITKPLTAALTTTP